MTGIQKREERINLLQKENIFTFFVIMFVSNCTISVKTGSGRITVTDICVERIFNTKIPDTQKTIKNTDPNIDFWYSGAI